MVFIPMSYPCKAMGSILEGSDSFALFGQLVKEKTCRLTCSVAVVVLPVYRQNL